MVLAVAVLRAAAAGAQAPAARLAITNVNVVDVARGTTTPGQTVLVTDGRIVSVSPARDTHLPRGTRVISGAGWWVIPGLWDMHTHVTTFESSSLAFFIAHGVTSIRDMGAERFAQAKAWRDSIAAGQLLGPRLLIAGPILENARSLAEARRWMDSTGMPWTLYERFAPTSVPEAERWVDSVARLGADHLKVRSWPPPVIAAAVVARARRLGLPVVAHAEEPFPRAGVTTFEHWLAPQPQGPAEARGALWRALAEGGTALVPTLMAGRAFVEPPDSALARLAEGRVEVLRYVPLPTGARWREQLLYLKRHERRLEWAEMRREELRNLAEMRAAGVPLVAGTDVGQPLLMPGVSLHEELTLLVNEAGLTPLDALRAATLSAARAAGATASIGSVDVGKLADLVLLDADPTVDVRNLRRIRAVVLNGRLFDRGALDALLTRAKAAGR